MIDVKQAVDVAKRYSLELFGSSVVPTLEEVELSDDGQTWYITLGYYAEPGKAMFAARLGVGTEPDRYRVFAVDCKSGNVRSMKVRKVG